MVIGDPYGFAIITQEISDWNPEGTAFHNGVLMICVNGTFFPKEIVTSTLGMEIYQLVNDLQSISCCSRLFTLPKNEAFAEIYDMSYPTNWEVYNNYDYNVTPESLCDQNCFVFLIFYQKKIRFLAANPLYNIAESKHNLSDLSISEAIISQDEISSITRVLQTLSEKW